MKLLLISIGLLSSSVAGAAELSDLIGSWRLIPSAGVSSVAELTFTSDGRVLADGKQYFGQVERSGRRVTARISPL